MYRNCKCNSCQMNQNMSNVTTAEPTVWEDICADVPSGASSYDSCLCGFDDEQLFPSDPMFGQSYVPWQTMQKTFTPRVGLKMGTIFPELVSPYEPCQSMKEIAHIAAMNHIGRGCNDGR